MRLVLAFAILALSTSGAAQSDPESPRQTAVFAELGGSAVAYSLNIERRLTPGVAIRAGAAYLEGGVLLPALALVSLTEPGTGLSAEVGLGVLAYIGADEGGSVPSALLGLRYQTADGVLFRLSLTPFYLPDGLFSLGDDEDEAGVIIPWGGVSAGYAF